MKLKEYPRSFIQALVLNLKSQYPLPLEDDVECIVSLTSIPSRLKTLHLTIKSLLLQNYKSKKIILWLNDELKETVPQKLLKLQCDNFEIIYRDQYSSHRKLVFALQEFDQKVIVTCDDDLMYESTWLESLMQDHLVFPKDIIANQCREITVASDGGLLPYRQWPTTDRVNCSALNLLPIGYGGVLYPPGVLHPDVINDLLYMRLAPKADDLWFKAMGLLQGTRVRRSSDPGKKPLPIIGAKGSSLAQTNILQDGNRIQWQAICDHYQIKTDCSE